MVFGAFDGVHPGHLDFFKQAKNHGDYLLVSVGTDKNVQAIKGKLPLFSQKDRLELISAFSIVDKAILGVEKDFYNQIMREAPDVICLGYDQWATEKDVRRELDRIGLLSTRIIRLKPFKQNTAKSTILKQKSVDF